MKANLCEGGSSPSPFIAVRSKIYATEHLFKTCFYKEEREERRNVGRRERKRKKEREKRKREKERVNSFRAVAPRPSSWDSAVLYC